MGHKVNPIGLRVGINRTWDSRWFASRGEYGKLLHEDMHIRDHILKQRRQAGIARVVIERPHKKCRVTVHTARPGVLIGKKGADIEKLRSELAKLTPSEVHLNIVEVRKPEIDATLVAETIAQQLERRVAFRRAMKRAVQSALRLGALGIRINYTVEGDLPDVGAEVQGIVDWDRRHRLMRTHTALHILCGVIWADYAIPVTGGNMEPLKGRLDFPFPAMCADLGARVEKRINEEIEKAREIVVDFVPRSVADADPALIRTVGQPDPAGDRPAAGDRHRRPRPPGRRRHARAVHRRGGPGAGHRHGEQGQGQQADPARGRRPRAGSFLSGQRAHASRREQRGDDGDRRPRRHR